MKWSVSGQAVHCTGTSHLLDHPAHHGVQVDGLQEHEHEAGQVEEVHQDGEDAAGLGDFLAYGKAKKSQYMLCSQFQFSHTFMKKQNSKAVVATAAARAMAITVQ